MELFNFTPYGEVSIMYEWNSKEVTSENYTKQYYRRRIHAKKTYSFTISGLDMPALVKFYDRHKGLEEPFYFTYDGATEVCRFAQAINPRCMRENGKIVAYSCEVSLEVEKQTKTYPVASESDVLPAPYGATDEQYNWNTQVVSMGVKSAWRNRQSKATRTIAGKWSGLKKDRDLLISLFNSHCRVPLTLRYNGETLKVIFPDKLEIKDKRELKTIVGYDCQMELEVV